MAKKQAQHGGKRPGAGRKPNPEGPAVVVAVSFPPALAADLDAYCKAQTVSRSAVVAEAVQGLLKRKKR